MELQALANEVGERLKARRETVAVSESSSGGLVSAALLAVPGASRYFVAGAVVYTGRARECCGKVVFSGLAVPPSVFAKEPPGAERLELRELADSLPPRSRTAHKGHFGHVVLVGGEQGNAL